MKLILIRSYYPKGTNGDIFYNGKKVCSTIELPWRNNASRISCIPEGEYELIKRYSIKFKWHLQLKDVPHRHLILIHPANAAERELKGCIAPVSKTIGPGMGLQSKLAFAKIYSLVSTEMKSSKQFFITIKCKEHVILDSSIS